MIIKTTRITGLWTEKSIDYERGYLNIFTVISNLILDKASELLADSENNSVPSFTIHIPMLEIIKKEFPNEPDFEYNAMYNDIENRIRERMLPRPKGFRQNFHSDGELVLTYEQPPKSEF